MEISIQRVASAPEEITSAEQVAETRPDRSGSTPVGVPDALSDDDFATENNSLEGSDGQMDFAKGKVVPIPSERASNGGGLFPIRILIGTTMVLVALVLGMGVVFAVAIGRRRRIDHSDDGHALSRSGEAVQPGHRVSTPRFPTWAAPALAGVGVAFMAGTGFLIATGGWKEDRVTSVWIDHEGESAALREAAKSGDSFAQFRLAVCYRDGLGVEADPVEAYRWFRASAESGHVGAQTQVAIDYLMEGGGVPVDFEQAIVWLQKAAAAGDVEARTHLGWCHANGFGVSQDFGQAERLLEDAAQEGNLLAMNGLARLLSGEIDGFEPDLERAFEWYLRAAEAGDRGAKYCVGVCLIEGRGVPSDRDAGWSWIEQSADMNFELAMEALRERSEQREIAKMNALLRQQIERNLQQRPQGGNPFSANPYTQYIPPQYQEAQRRANEGLRQQGYSDEILRQQGYR
ncbi:MAG: sel1 repeat family protein [Verrucomicrobiae bacterium]|nr:sel1 repeat family protein [Verrucomicrobiae bacterium]